MVYIVFRFMKNYKFTGTEGVSGGQVILSCYVIVVVRMEIFDIFLQLWEICSSKHKFVSFFEVPFVPMF